MRQIQAQIITQTVRDLCISANMNLPQDVKDALISAREKEPWPLAKQTLSRIVDNFVLAEEKQLPICQDTGMAVVFITIGQDVHVVGSLQEAIQEGVRQGYRQGLLRASVVGDPLERVNTKDNTPALIHMEIAQGDALHIEVAPKGFGSENMSAIRMLKPSDGIQGVKAFVLDTVKKAGPNPCPPIVVGVGIGGSFDRAALLAKKALLRPVGSAHAKAYYRALENVLLLEINALGIGPQGFGGLTTALCVHIETFPTHIASLPCAVNINCHVSRHKSATL